MRIEQQRSARNLNGKVSRERDWRLWWQCVGAVAVGVLLVVGFAVAAQRHITAHECSLQNVVLERERERLLAEQKRLLLEREETLSLEELRKKAKKIGMQEVTAGQINALGGSAQNTMQPQLKTRPNGK